ncbi:MAG: serine/threonine protein kinase [Candidatus Methanoperedenaceae archaeon]|nr:serine/threonine protein kinase [Candidatus Methanoperedenaceae archaeon]
MPESIPDLFLNIKNREFRVLVAIENKMSSFQWVPVEEIAGFTKYNPGEVSFILSNLAHKKLIQRTFHPYEGYRIYYEAYDMLALNAFVKRGTINAIGDVIGVGKESVVYDATGGITERRVVIKFHREGKTSFKHVKRNREHIGERKHISWIYASRLAAEREYRALKILYPQVSVPEPIDQNRNAIVMSVARGKELIHSVLDEPEWFLDEILGNVKKAYDLGIIHADLSEFNIFVNHQGCELIDWPQYVLSSNANAYELLFRDIDNVLTYFKRKYRIVRDSGEVTGNMMGSCQEE